MGGRVGEAGQPKAVGLWGYNPSDVRWYPLRVGTLGDGLDSLLVTFRDGQYDPFSRLRVSNPVTLFDGQFLSISSQVANDPFPLLWYPRLAGAGSITYLPTRSALQLRVTANGDEATYQSKGYLKYQGGNGVLVQCTGLFPAATGVTSMAGLFDDDDGVFFQVQNGQAAFVVRSSVTGVVVPIVANQANWNIDKLNGANDATNQTGIALDLSRTQNIVIDLQWLGVGRVRVGFDIAGHKIYVHEFNFSNVGLNAPYMRTATLPVRYQIVGAAGIAGNSDLIAICCMVASEGGISDALGLPFSVGNGTTLLSTTTRRPILSIRPRSGLTPVNRVPINLKRYHVFADNNNVFYELVYGGTLTGATFAAVDATYSVIERDVAATAITGGVVIDVGYVVAAPGAGQEETVVREILSKLPLALDIAGSHPTTPLTDSLTIVATSHSGTANVAGAFDWNEQR